jgi:hypothetical protein
MVTARIIMGASNFFVLLERPRIWALVTHYRRRADRLSARPGRSRISDTRDSGRNGGFELPQAKYIGSYLVPLVANLPTRSRCAHERHSSAEARILARLGPRPVAALPLEKSLTVTIPAEPRATLTHADHATIARLALKMDQAFAAASKRGGVTSCSLQDDFIVLDVDGNATLCCASMADRSERQSNCTSVAHLTFLSVSAANPS